MTSEEQKIRAALAEIVAAEVVDKWLDEPNDAFDGSSPRELIRRGETDRLWAAIHDLSSGNPA